MTRTMPTSTKPKLLSPVLLRVAGLSIDVLDGLRAPVITHRLHQYEHRRRRVESRKEPLLADLFAVIEKHCPPGKPQQQLQQLRRDLHNDRAIRPKELAQAQHWLSESLLDQLMTYINDRQALERYMNTTAKLYRQQAIQGRQHFQQLVGNAAFQRGLALSSLSLLRQVAAYQQTNPASFRKDDFQVENGLLRYLSRAATKTTPYSTLTHLTTMPVHAGESLDWKAGPPRSHVRLSVRLLGVFDAILRTNRRLYEQWPVTVNPSVLISGENLSYIRQTNGQVACVKISLNPVLRWVTSARRPARTYKDWIDRIQQKFRSTSLEAHQYIDKLIELGLLQHPLPVSAADADWAIRLQDWLTQYRWMAPKFVDSQLSLLHALLATATILPMATPGQRLSLLSKAYGVLAEHIGQLPAPPAPDFWPLRAEQLFFEDVTRSLQGHLPKPDVKRLITSIDRLTRHMVEVYTPPAYSLVNLFKTTYPTTELIPVTTFFAHYLSQSEPFQKSAVIAPDIRQQWERWATEGLRADTVQLQSEWIPDSSDTLLSQAVFWQSWTDSRGRLCAALNELAGGFGRLYGRFLPYFNHSLTHELVKTNRGGASADCLLVEATDDHYHNANFHPALVEGTILTPAGHVPPSSVQAISLSELSVRLSDDGQRVDLWHAPSRKRVQVVDMGFQADRSRLYTFLCLFAPLPELSLSVFNSVINAWYAEQKPVGTIRIGPRIVLDRRLIIQRKTWWLPVGAEATLPVEGDSFTFFRAAHSWQQRYQLPDEVFVSLPDAPNPDDHKPQYIRFDNALLVDLFRRLVRKAVTVGAVLKVVEMRPTSDELICIEGQRYAVEAVPQWYAPKPANSEGQSISEEVENQPLVAIN
jgi:hypothetical protein